MEKKYNKVSVIIPVYNEIRFIERTLNSVLGEADEIILSDNASTDGTSDICQRYASIYPEIKYFRGEETRNANDNFQFAINKSTGEYIYIIGGHDMLSRGSIKKMAEILDRDDSAVMVYPKYIIKLHADYTFMAFHHYDEFGNDLESDSPFQRVRSLIKNIGKGGHGSWAFLYALYRQDVFEKLDRFSILKGITTDHITLSFTASQGKMLSCDDAVFFFMWPRPPEASIIENHKRYLNTFYPGGDYDLGFWAFAFISEQYNLALDMQSLPGCPENFGEEILDILIQKYGYLTDFFEFNYDRMPPIVSGKEPVCRIIEKKLHEYKRKKIKEKNKNFGAAMIKKIKTIIKYILPFGIYKILELRK
jgi:glycosyltransferase involved in cell wall biosynthesis